MSQVRLTKRDGLVSFDAKVVRVLIASPGDTGSARSVLKGALEDWNSLHAEETKVMLLPVLWERDATPEMGDRPQALINRQLVDAADMLVGTFWTRLGTPTGEAQSGTVEEIERCIAAQKPVLLYFSRQPVALDSVDHHQYQQLQDFKQSLEPRGLYDSYDSEANLFRKVNAAVTRTMRRHFDHLFAEPPSEEGVLAPGPRAAIAIRVEREREISSVNKLGRPQYRSRHYLIVENRGTAAADNVTITPEAAEGVGGEPPQAYGAETGVSRLAPGGQLRYPLLMTMGSAPQWNLRVQWEEDGVAQTETQTVRG